MGEHAKMVKGVYELYPDSEAPETEWEYTAREDWPPVLQQDFANMAAVQRGIKCGGFRGAQPNPYMERAIPYGPGWYAFEALLQTWRDEGRLKGLSLEGTPATAS